jgi:hypothetical protein
MLREAEASSPMISDDGFVFLVAHRIINASPALQPQSDPLLSGTTGWMDDGALAILRKQSFNLIHRCHNAV